MRTPAAGRWSRSSCGAITASIRRPSGTTSICRNGSTIASTSVRTCIETLGVLSFEKIVLLALKVYKSNRSIHAISS